MALNTGEGDGTAGTRQLADERDGHQQTDPAREDKDTTPLLGRIEALERALRAGSATCCYTLAGPCYLVLAVLFLI